MIALFIAPFYLFICGYILTRFFKAVACCHPFIEKRRIKFPATVLFGILAFSPIIAFLLPYHTTVRQIAQLTNAYWFGAILYILLITVISQLISVFLRRVIKVVPNDFFKRKRVSIVCLALSLVTVLSVCSYGFYNARNIRLTEYSVSINKNAGNIKKLKIALIADLHIGYSIGLDHIKKTVEMVNSQKPDLVCIAGDIYDNDFNAIQEPDAVAKELAKMKSTYGTYACWGNHDVDEKILAGFTFGGDKTYSRSKDIEDFMKKADIKTLSDETVLVDNSFYVSGRLDGSKPVTDGGERKTPDEILKDLDKSKPVVVLYHEPDQLEELSKAGTDLLLCGHTHDGQLFPGNIITGLRWGNAAGYLKKGDMHNIVTSGVGVWGPFMRVGTKAEVVSIDVTFRN